MWEFLWRNEVAPADLYGIDPELFSYRLNRPFDQVCSFRAAGASIGLGGCGVCQTTINVSRNDRNVVAAGRHQRGNRRDTCAPSRDISADIRVRHRFQSDDLAILVRRDSHQLDMIPTV